MLGALLIDNDAWDVIAGMLAPDAFYFSPHRMIWASIKRMIEARRQADVLTVAEDLTSRGEIETVGGVLYLHSLADSTPSAANIRVYASIVKDRMQLRWMANFADQLRKRVVEANGTDAQFLLDQASQQLALIGSAAAGQRGTLRPFSDALTELMVVLDQAATQAQKTGVAGIPSGFDDLDRVLGGFKPGQLVVIAGRPAMGKTAIAVNIAEHIAFQTKRPSAIFTMEMGQAEMAARVVSSMTRIHGLRLSHGRLSAGEFDTVGAVLPQAMQAPLYICEDGSLTLAELSAGVRRFKRQAGEIGAIVIDYFGLMAVERPSGNHAQDLGLISKGIKALAKEVGAPVLLLAQLNRELEKRGNKRPVLSDLRDSGCLEQDADIVLMVYRDAVYNENASEREAELLLRKHRGGPLRTIQLDFDPACTRFGNAGAER